MRISQSGFAARRQQLMDQMAPGSVAIIPAAADVPRNRDVEYPFRQDSDFYYLTGFNEPDALLLLIPGRSEGQVVIFCRDRDPEMEIWNGYRAGPEGVCKQYGADQAYPVAEMDERMAELLEGRARLYYSMGSSEALDGQVRDWLNSIRKKARLGAVAPSEIVMLDHLLHEMRLFKSAEEIEVMRAAGRISAEAHVRAMKACQPGLLEYQLEAEITHHFAMNGCRLPAYSSIVGGGDNACVLHYTENRDELKNGDLVLIDAGCELDYYAGDITRTFPVSGKFSPEQQAVYELVLKSQLACIEAIRPGVPWIRIHDLSVEILTQGLIDLGLLKGDLEGLIESGAYKAFYMHRIGHWLGMDVHDVGDYKVNGDWRPLEPGMVMTVEPGIYISPQNEHVDKRWRGIGIRIEDDVLVTENGYEILSAGVPKSVAEIEQLMAR
ncbi:aminopeptidase P . Metallo peptidase. MEROPS family M24B [Amphritea atlantica]|uniref:Xaa-Pro aminopeptidase n=1 Tax=Amphritea atlantica TaxID=355243 RepID=A0A1H9K2P1_9GAMM|nr:Xaa-Pro aminopeptidase [Amphritea atlantica]SEQ93360.1 aminopeptidase P . Metallo peptidase. MEROPS family M24B [Amphritea atlantica]